jgi:hypothetical protein
LSFREQPVGGAVSGAVRVLLVQAHFIRPYLREQPPDEVADSFDVIYVILAFRLTIDLLHEASVRSVHSLLAVEFAEIVINDN